MMMVILAIYLYLASDGHPRGSAAILPYCTAGLLDYLLCGGLAWLLWSILN